MERVTACLSDLLATSIQSRPELTVICFSSVMLCHHLSFLPTDEVLLARLVCRTWAFHGDKELDLRAVTSFNTTVFAYVQNLQGTIHEYNSETRRYVVMCEVPWSRGIVPVEVRPCNLLYLRRCSACLKNQIAARRRPNRPFGWRPYVHGYAWGVNVANRPLLAGRREVYNPNDERWCVPCQRRFRPSPDTINL